MCCYTGYEATATVLQQSTMTEISKPMLRFSTAFYIHLSEMHNLNVKACPNIGIVI